MFGMTGNASAEEAKKKFYGKSDSGKSKKFASNKPKERVYPNARVVFPKGETAEVIFLDDVAEYTEEQNFALRMLGIHMGPFRITEHRSQLENPWTKRRTWRNWHTCLKALSLDRSSRVMLAKNFGLWDSIGKYLEDASFDEAEALYMGMHWDTDTLSQFLTEKQMDYGKELFDLAVGSSWDCPICTLAWETKKDNKGDDVQKHKIGKASIRVFRSIIDLSSYTSAKGVTYENQVKILEFGGKQYDPIDKQGQQVSEFAGKKRVGLSRYKMMFTRGIGQTDSAVPMNVTGEYSLEDLQRLNPDSVITLNRDRINAILTEDCEFRTHFTFAETGKPRTADELTEEFTALLCPDGDVLFPYPVEYQRLLLPKSPTYLGKVFEDYIDVADEPKFKELTEPKAVKLEAPLVGLDDDVPF